MKRTSQNSGLPAAARLGLAGAVLLAAVSGYAGLNIPYTNDVNTLHLWHLDDTSGQLYATDVVTTASITLTNYGLPNPGTGPYTNVTFGGPAFPGMGTCCYCASTGVGNGVLGKEHLLYGGPFSSVAPFRNPVTGAFTFEALIYNTINPLGTIDAEIVCGDNGGAITARGWQWRLSNGTMEWDLLAGSTDNDFKANLPSTGPDAALPNTWYHVAVTFTGSAPTNSDPAGVLTMYWTLLDANRTYADVLGTWSTTATGAALRPLDGGAESPAGATPSLGIGGSARATTSNPGNNEGLAGGIDEVRISQVCLKSNQMAFVTGGALNPPKITLNPPATVLSGYDQPLVISPLATGTSPLSYQWYQNNSAVSGQTNLSLDVLHATFAANGAYALVVTNPYGKATTTVSQVTIGAVPSELYATGLDTNGLVSAGDIPDPHWILWQSGDPGYLGPAAPILEENCPIQFACPSGNFSPSNGVSMWISAQGNQGGAAPSSPAGEYIYRTTFLLDSAVPSTVSMNGVLWMGGSASVTNILVNGKPTGVSVNPGAGLYVGTFSIPNQNFVPGLNTLDFLISQTAGAFSAIRIQLTALGQALQNTAPIITNQPVSAIVRDSTVSSGSAAAFSVVALGTPPLSYQWWANGSPLVGATARSLQFTNPVAGAQGTNFFVVVANPYGTATSRVASLTIVDSNQPPAAATFNYVGFQGQNVILPLSSLVQISTDPDGDALMYDYSDVLSTNAVQYGTNNIVQVGALLEYSPVEGYIGDDQFTYTIQDVLGATAVGYVNVLTLVPPAPAAQTVAPGLSATFTTGMVSPPSGYTFQWQFNGANVAGATGGSLTITNVALANTGVYKLVVTDPHGVAWPSPGATLTVEVYAPQAVTNNGITASSNQPNFPPENAVDGDLTTFWVSSGTASGQGPSVSNPEWLQIAFPQVQAISEFLVYPRSGYGPANMQVLFNGAVAYTGTMANSATPLDVVLSPPVYATNAELLVTSSYDPTYPTSPRNVQVMEVVFLQRAAPGTFGDWELNSFTNSAQINDPAIAGIGADPDHDGVPNLLEFAVGGNPWVSDATNAAMRAILLPGGQVAVQFQERNQLGDVTRKFLASPDLTTWTDAVPVSVTPVQNLGAVSINQAVFPASPGDLYYRLSYTLPDWQRK